MLERLSNAPEDILSDIPLIEGLEATKRTANEINEVSNSVQLQCIYFSSYTRTQTLKAVTRGIQTEIGINQAREVTEIFDILLLNTC